MRVLLINPPKVNGLSVIREDRCEITEQVSTLPPYSLLQIAAILRNNGNEVFFIDANGSDVLYDELSSKISSIMPFDVLIFRFTPTTYEDDIKVAKITKNLDPRIKTVGLCWTLKSFAEKVLEDSRELDIYSIGDYITTIPKLIISLNKVDDLRNVPGIVYRQNGKILKNDIEYESYSYDALPLPAYDLLPTLNNYFANTKHGMPYTIIYSSKGCPYKCVYCTMAETEWKARSSDSIITEIKYLKTRFGLKSFSFFDETFTYDRDRVIDICNKMIEEKINAFWYCNTRANKVDFELLKLMKRAGCKGISLGVESGSQEILNNAKKGTKVEQNENAIKEAKKAGIKTYCSFIFGLPGENWNTVEETVDFVKRTLPNGAQFNVIVPYPGTKLFDMAVEKKWISNTINWTKLYQHLSTMRTEHLSSEDLENARKKAYRSLYFDPKWMLMNLEWILRNPEDLPLAVKFYIKSLKNYFIHGMEHAH